MGRVSTGEHDFDEEAALESFIEGAEDDLTSGDLVENADQLADALASADEASEEDEALVRCMVSHAEDDFGGAVDTSTQPVESFSAEVGELPDSLSAEQLARGAEVDLSAVDLTLEQARRVAQVLATNEELIAVKLFNGHNLAVGDLKEDNELEWDSEEYDDVDAIIIAELLRANTTVSRLDLARNAIGDAGAHALAGMLGENATLEYLNLESNPFGEIGGRSFVTALGNNTTVQYLNLKEIGLPSVVEKELKAQWQQGGRAVGLHL